MNYCNGVWANAGRLSPTDIETVETFYGGRFSPPRLALKHFGRNATAGSWDVFRHPRFLADVNGDGRADIVGFGNRNVSVALSNGRGFDTPRSWIADYGFDAGHWRVSMHPRLMADVNGDGKADIVGFGEEGVSVSLSTGRSFEPRRIWLKEFGRKTDSWDVIDHPRVMADVNGDGKADIVGFGNGGVSVSLSNGNGFQQSQIWVAAFGRQTKVGEWKTAETPRVVADVNGDGKADVIGFSDDGVHVALSTGAKFEEPSLWVSGFGQKAGWYTWKHPRMVVDIDGDGRADVVGFADDGVYVALSTGDRFAVPKRWVGAYGYVAGRWRGVLEDDGKESSGPPKGEVFNLFLANAGSDPNNGNWTGYTHPRLLADLTGTRPKRLDMVGFADAAVSVARNVTGTTVRTPVPWVTDYSIDKQWTVQHPRLLGDVNGDGKMDIVGFGPDGVILSFAP